ncbi:MAG: GGDEF domain-containing protein [Gammaproteobacteria bacterium]|nr:GGDEF domain-containing protein [Gammaproteobacteria bacterium]
MRVSFRVVSGLLTLLGAAGACRASETTFAALGDNQWPLAAFVLGLGTVACLIALILTRRKMNRIRRRLLEVEHELAHKDQTEHVLKEAHERLEGRVRERTADLEMSYRKLNDARDSLVAVNQKLDSVARVDDMTGIANRTRFDESLETEIKRSLRSRKPLSLILVGLDEFDTYRRQYGRDRADEVVVKTAQEMAKTFKRAPDIVARYDDSHFGIVMPETEVRDAMRFAERLRQVVFQSCVPFPESESSDRVTASVGVATMQPDKLYSASDFVNATLSALKDARDAGGNTIEYGTIRRSSDIELA